MRFALTALAGGLVLIAATAYADDPMSMTYGNTITSKDQSGGTAMLYFEQNGTYTTKATMNGKPVQLTGKWTLQDGGKSLCLTPDAPPNATQPPQTSCSPLEQHQVGDTWTVTNDQKQVFQVTLTAGR